MMFRYEDWKIYICQYLMIMEIEGQKFTSSTYLKLVIFQANSPDEAVGLAEKNITQIHDRYKDENGDIINITCQGIYDINLLQNTWEQIDEQSKDV